MKVQDRLDISLSQDPMNTKYVYEEDAQKEIAEKEAELEEIYERHRKDESRADELEAKIEAANKILDLAHFEDLTGAHKILWSDWKALKDALKIPRKEPDDFSLSAYRFNKQAKEEAKTT